MNGEVVAPASDYRACTARSDVLSGPVQDFSLVLGGPIYQLFARLGLISPPLHRIGARIAFFAFLAWAPILVLAAFGGRLTGGVRIPFLFDFEVHARLLVALPLLIGAEVTMHRRVHTLLLQFVDRQIVGARVLPKFDDCIRSALRLRNSAVIELGLLVLVFAVGGPLARDVLPIQSDTWQGVSLAGTKVLTSAGYWYRFVSVPIFQFIVLRWYFRLLVWTRLLWQISRLDLNLVPSHPDGRCGLGFLGGVAIALGPFLMAHSVLLAGYMADKILYEGARLPDYKLEIAVLAAFLYLLAFGPMTVFTPRLMRRRLQGLRAYGALASEYVIGFERKWMQGERPDEPLVGSADIQSLADLANSFAVVQNVKVFPFSRQAIVNVAVIVALPLLPLGLTMFSLEELLTRLAQVIL